MAIPVIIIKRIIAALKLSRRNAQFITDAEATIAAVAAHSALFPNPSPPLSTVTAHINDLRAKQNIALTRLRGAAQARNVAKNIVAKDLRRLRVYVQQIADNDPEHSKDIILTAGLKVKASFTRVKPDFAATNGKLSGVILLIARAISQRSSHEWQSSLNGVTWTSLPSTLQAKTEVSGLNPGTRMFFRHRRITKEGPESWSQVVSIIVI